MTCRPAATLSSPPNNKYGRDLHRRGETRNETAQVTNVVRAASIEVDRFRPNQAFHLQYLLYK